MLSLNKTFSLRIQLVQFINSNKQRKSSLNENLQELILRILLHYKELDKQNLQSNR